jgi:deoxyribonuclease-4
MKIRFGPAGLGPVKDAEETLQELAKEGLRACEIAFTYGVYIKKEEDAVRIGKKARELDVELSAHAPYWVNLNSDEKAKREATKKRILDSCKIGELLGAKVVVFHPGYYGKDKTKAYEVIKEGILEIQNEIKKKGWKIKLAPETMGKINVFGSVEEISRLAKETGCAFCLDFAHILAREKKVDYAKIGLLFPQEKWHCHFSGIVYGEKGEKHHITTPREKWKELFAGLPSGKEVRIINESPTMVEDCVEGLGILKKSNRES